MSWRANKPPRVPEWILFILVEEAYRDDVLGDMHEEFVERSRTSLMAATFWYWLQVARSLPRVIARRIETVCARQIAAIMAGYTVAILVFFAWDLGVSQSAIGSLVSSMSEPNLLLVRVAYFTLICIGALLSGAIAAFASASGNRSLVGNMLIGVIPVALVPIAMAAWTVIQSGALEHVIYLSLRCILISLTMFVGAYWSVKAKQRYVGSGFSAE